MNLMKFRPLFLIISLFLLSASFLSIYFWGFRLSVDFTGGSAWQINLPSKPEKSTIEDIFTRHNLSLNSLSQNDSVYLLKFPPADTNQKNELTSDFKKLDSQFSEQKFESLGPLLGKELLRKTLYALILASLFLLLYIGTRFKDFSFGLSAILAMIHDAIILTGSFAVLGHFFGAELDALFVTALLTTLSASVHDTVVTFDRIRELKTKTPRIDWTELANRAVSEVIVRSINNSMTIVFMLLALVLLGGESTRWFATALLIGVVCGTYSSTAVAIPLMLLTKKNESRK